MSDHLPIRCTLSKLPIHFGNPLNNNKQACKERWDKADLWSYYGNTGSILQDIDVPVHVMQCKSDCVLPAHLADINRYYNNFVDALNLQTVVVFLRFLLNVLSRSGVTS